MKLSEPHSNPDVRIISLGAGVQSTVMALMAAKGELDPMPIVPYLLTRDMNLKVCMIILSG